MNVCVSLLSFLVVGFKLQQPTDSPFVTTANPRPSAYYIVYDSPKQITAKETYTFDYPNYDISDFQLFLAKAPSMPYRQKLTTTLNLDGYGPVQYEQVEPGPLKRSMLYVRLFPNPPIRQLKLDIGYQGTLYPYHFKKGNCPYADVNLSDDVRDAYLSQDRELTFGDPRFHNWLQQNQLVIREKEDPVEFGYRVYGFVANHINYGQGGGTNTVTNLLNPGVVRDCGGYATLFVAIMRANRIPATILCGRLASSGDPNKPYDQMHVMAQFWAEHRGWCPIGFFDRNDDSTFGRFKGDFIVTHVGIDIGYLLRGFGGSLTRMCIGIAQGPVVFVGSNIAGGNAINTTTGQWIVNGKK